MLQAIRDRAGSWVVKALFGLLILTFAVWGIGDIFRRGGGETTVLVVGEQKVPASELQTAWRAELDRMRNIFGGAIDTAQAKAIGLLDQVIEGVVRRELLTQEADRLNLALADDVIRRSIHTSPAFQGAGGTFDRNLYAGVLRQNRLSEAAYEAQLRGDLLREQLAGALSDGAAAPEALAAPLYQQRFEKRVVDLVFIPMERAGDVAEPTDQDLAEIYDRLQESFRTPEYRGFTALLLTPEVVAADIQIPEDKLRAEYEQRGEEFAKPERRALKQMVFADEEKAKQAAAALSEGKDFAEVAKEVAGQDEATTDLGWVRRQDLPRALAEAAFAVEEGKTSEPLQTPLGWHIVKVDGEEKGGIPPYEELRDRLREALAHDQAVDRLYKLTNEVEDALAGGATVEEAAKRFNLKATKVEASDPGGRGPGGEEIQMPAREEVLRLVFETGQGQTSRMTESKDGSTWYLVHVDSITPSRIRPQAEVTEALKRNWIAEKQSAAVEKMAKEIAGSVGEGKALGESAQERGLEVKTSEPFLRTGAGSPGLPSPLVGQIFSAQEGAVSTGAGPGGWYIAQLKSIERPEPSQDAVGMAQLQRQLEQSVREDILFAYDQALRRRFKVEIRRDEIDRFF